MGVISDDNIDYDDLTNNSDMIDLFSNLFKIILLFNNKYSNAVIVIKGNTIKKTKSYINIILRHSDKLDDRFYITGKIGDKFEKLDNISNFEKIALFPKNK